MKKALLLMALLLLVLTWRTENAAGQRSGAGSLVGVWVSQTPTPWGLSYTRTILMPDGTFTKTAKAGHMFTWDTGVYTLGPDFIHFIIQDHEPKFYLGQPMRWVTSETVFFRFLGPDSISCEDRITGTRWTAHRLR
jgi:hypothetical protein